MSEIQHHELKKFINGESHQPWPGVYLIHGQEMLVEKSSEQLISTLLDGESADLCCEKIEGVIENLSDALERLNTFSLLMGPKIVMFKEARLFEGRRNSQRLVDQVVEAWKSEDEHQAAKSFLNLCSRFEIDLEGTHHEAKKNEMFKSLLAQMGTDGVEKLIHYCLNQGWSPKVSGDHVEVLQKAIEKGFPKQHYLIVTVYAKVPKNLKLYKSFKHHGVVIDCNIPLGERRSDKAAQEAVLRQTLDELLAKANKTLSPGAFQILCQLTGFDPRIFVQNVEKLIDYVGKRPDLTVEDIHCVLKRTKVDPVFELTNAVADRNLIQSLSYMKTLLDAKWHPLQILSALANQMRKLLVAKSFATSDYGKCWSRGISYPQFQKSVMPSIVAYDKQVRKESSNWLDRGTDKTKKGKGGKKKAPDVVLAANPKSPYPVYQTLLKAEKYTLQELINAMTNLNQTDLRLKSTGQDAAMVLKKTIEEICGIKGRGSNKKLK
jgi:DNA polymerase-3 subunit delta